MLRRSDAAYLPPGIPGRGYLQVGNENLELIQVAHTGGDYLGEQQSTTPDVIWLDRQHKQKDEKRDEPPKLYEVIVKMLATQAQEMYPVGQWRPWPKPLPPVTTLNTLLDIAYIDDDELAILPAYRYQETLEASAENPRLEKPTLAFLPITLNPFVQRWVEAPQAWPGVDWEIRGARPPLGLIDNPYDAKQLPLTINLQAGNAVLFGSSGWGKTTFLRTLITSLAASHSPEELHMYILDFGGRNLAPYQNLPQVGAVITSEEEERVQRLLRKINTWLEQRQLILSEAGVNDLYTYNAKNPARALPVILVVIDNFAEFKESFEDLLNPLVSILREARANGIHFVVTAEQPGALSGKIYPLFTERLTLKLADPTEYSAIVGRGVPGISDIPGRGFIKVGRQPLEFQIALPFEISDRDKELGLDEAAKLKQLAANMSLAWEGQPVEKRPPQIETLPSRLLLDTTPEECLWLRPIGTGLFPAPAVVDLNSMAKLASLLGLDDLALQPSLLDLQKMGPHCVVIGPANSGKTTTLRTLILSLAYSYSPQQIALVLVDYQRRLFDYGGKLHLGSLPQVVQVVSKWDDLPTLVQGLRAEFRSGEKPRRVFVFIDNYDGFSEETGRSATTARKTLDELGLLAREHGTDGLHFIASGSLSLFSANDDLRKQMQASNYGVALQTKDAVEKLNGKVPRSLVNTELPIGRGFIVKSSRTAMVQVAAPYGDDENLVETTLDAWVKKICARYPVAQSGWITLPPLSPTLSDGKSADPFQHIDMEALGKLLPLLPEGLTPADIVKIAEDMGITPPLKENPA